MTIGQVVESASFYVQEVAVPEQDGDVVQRWRTVPVEGGELVYVALIREDAVSSRLACAVHGGASLAFSCEHVQAVTPVLHAKPGP